MRRPLPVLVSPAQVPTDDEIRAEYRARVDAYIARLAHVEFLIRNRLVRAEELLAGTSSGGTPRFPPLLESGSFNWLSSSRCAPSRRVEPNRPTSGLPARSTLPSNRSKRPSWTPSFRSSLH